MIFKNLLNKLRNAPKRYVLAVAVGLAISVPLAVQAGYGPNRPVFDWNNEAQRKGSETGPVFNSFINTPSYGDERAFVDAKDSANTNTGGFSDTVNVEGGKEYTVRAYVHNNANQATNASGLGVARNTKVRFNILPGVANGNEVTGYISADNSTPTIVYDTVKLKNDVKAFSLEYVPGSARLESNAHPYPGVALPDSITTTGALIGDNRDGLVLGCFEYTEIITIKVRVKTPSLTVQKGVTTVDAPKPTDLKENITVKPGDSVTWRIDYKNNGTDAVTNTTIRDAISDQLTLVPGSITWFDSNHQAGETFQDTALGSGGVNVGTYQPNTNGVIRYKTVVKKDTKACEINNIAIGRADNVPDVQDNAKITIDSEHCKPAASYSCDALTINKIADRKYGFNVAYSAQSGAKFKHVTYNFGDGTADLVTDKTSVEHTYAKDGSYVTKATVTFTVNGRDVTATGTGCMKTIPVNVAPTTLPDTGAGHVFGIFSGVSVLGAMLHRRFSRG